MHHISSHRLLLSAHRHVGAANSLVLGPSWFSAAGLLAPGASVARSPVVARAELPAGFPVTVGRDAAPAVAALSLALPVPVAGFVTARRVAAPPAQRASEREARAASPAGACPPVSDRAAQGHSSAGRRACCVTRLCHLRTGPRARTPTDVSAARGPAGRASDLGSEAQA